MAGMIEVEDLHVVFGHGSRAVHAVRGIRFRVDRGEAYGIVGESGSGKSTVLRAIARLNTPWTGAIRVAGQPLGQRRARATARQLQMVFQDPYGSLHPRHTVNDILREPLQIHGIDRQEPKILQALDDVGLGVELRFRYPHQISGGQRQRVAIARALILEPEILLLDEPTSALDVSVQAEILNLLMRLKAERGLTYLMVSHNLAVVAHLCRRITVMNRGSVVEELTTEQLRADGAQHEYTRQLIMASRGYDRDVAEQIITYS